MSRKLKIAAIQKRAGSHLQITEFDRWHERGIDLLCLPEYFFVVEGVRHPREMVGRRRTILTQLEAYSRRLAGIVVGGTLIEQEGNRLYNTCHIFDSGRYVGFYRKRHPTSHEQAGGISPGDEFKVFDIRGFRLGVLICADVLHPDSFLALAKLQPELIAVPTVSPYLEDDTIENKYRRDQDLFVAGAKTANAYILKACGVGDLMGERLQGRSLICSPQGILQRVNPRAEAFETVLTAEIDLDILPTPPRAAVKVGVLQS